MGDRVAKIGEYKLNFQHMKMKEFHQLFIIFFTPIKIK